MNAAISNHTVRPASYRLSWQLSLRSMLVLTAMAAMTLAWWRSVGITYFRGLPAYWEWQGWFLIGTIACPFLVPLAGPRFQSHWHVGYLVKVWVFMCGANAIWGFFQSLSSSAEGPDAQRHLIELLYELHAAEFWTAFALPASLAVVASTSIPQPRTRAMLWDYGLILVVALNVVLLSRLTPFVLGKAWGI